jgi:hypothetical protein
MAHLQVCLAYDLAEKEFQMSLHGHKPGVAQKTKSVEDILASARKGGGTQRETVNERISPTSKVYQRYNTKTGMLETIE